MKRLRILAVLVLVGGAFSLACSEVDEAADDENDIVVRNLSKDDIWVDVDGISLTHVNDDGRAEEIAEDLPDGRYLLRAYADENGEDLICEVETDFLSDGEDFYWYLEDDDEYSGSKSGDC